MNDSPVSSSSFSRDRAALVFVVVGNLMVAWLLSYFLLEEAVNPFAWLLQFDPFAHYSESGWYRIVNQRLLMVSIVALGWQSIRRARREKESSKPGAHAWLAAILVLLLLHAVFWRAQFFLPCLAVFYALLFCGIGWLGGCRLIGRLLPPLVLMVPLFVPSLGQKLNTLQRSFYACFPMRTPEQLVRWDIGAEPRSGPVMPIHVSEETYALFGKLYDDIPGPGTLLLLVALAMCFSQPKVREKRVIWTTGVILALFCAWMSGMGNGC